MYTSSPFIFIICEEGFFGGDCCLRVVRRDSFVDLITSRWNWMCFAKNSDWRYVTSYITRTRPRRDEHDTWTRGKFLKLQLHTTHISDTRVGHVSDPSRLHNRSVRAT